MKKLIYALALALCLSMSHSLTAQDGPPAQNGISAKVLFLDYSTLDSNDGFKISNGIELAYVRALHPKFNLALPVKIALANLDGSDKKSTLVSFDLTGQFLFAGSEGRVSPYLMAGAGFVFEEFETNRIEIPVGLGLYVRAGESSFFTVQGEYRKAFQDERDNLQVGVGWHFRLKPSFGEDEDGDADGDGLPDAQDHCPDEAGTLLANGCPDTDGDGVANGLDDCPTEKGIEKFKGCPDTDEDGIPDATDKCPTEKGPNENGGCPLALDSDGDGIVDEEDDCPNVPGVAAKNGCPETPVAPADKDADGIADAQDECPDQAGPASTMGCPDGDGDGIADKDDKCPTVFGPKDRNGCPPEPEVKKDTDGDGVLDENDDCPQLAGTAALKGCPDSDGDGIADKYDACPNEMGTAARNGCPVKDTDGDGFADEDDECPNEKGKLLGCPDRDGDGINDKNDRCPDEAGTAERNGCPRKDSDQDGIWDEDDKCPNEAGSATAEGCPDSDGDGIADKNDKCPRTFGKFNGCPDTDGDGVDDGTDLCPNAPGEASANGCPDSDGDGTPDKDDKCPNEVGTNKGCPDIKKEDKEFLALAAKNVQFETGKATLTAQSFNVLNQVADILARYPNYNLSIGGHTDNVGNDAGNLALSEERAKSCYEYLRSRNVSTDRMNYKGFGETQPLGNNSTPEGREANRRVEFNMVLK